MSSSLPPTVPIPPPLWTSNPSPSLYSIPDPHERYRQVNLSSAPTAPIPPTFPGNSAPVQKFDLHYQSTLTFTAVLSAALAAAGPGEIWVVTGRGGHVDAGSFQKGGGVLFQAVLDYLEGQGDRYALGKGGGAILLY